MNSHLQCKITVNITEEWHVSWDDVLTDVAETIVEHSAEGAAIDAAHGLPQQQLLTIEGTDALPQLFILQRLPHGLGWQLLTEAEARAILCSPPIDP